jgi:ABC-type phosphate transport system substrate-binding protein
MSFKSFRGPTLRFAGRLGSLLSLGLVLLSTADMAAAADTAGAVEAQEYVVIVNKDNPTTQLSADEIADIFLGKVMEWPNGWRLEPLDRSLHSGIRLAFTRAVHKKSVGAVNKYWMNQVYSGRGEPPRVVDSDEKVVAFISANPGAIGYVSAAFTGPGVRALGVVD